MLNRQQIRVRRDGPNHDEVLVLMVVASRGRLYARLGGLTLEQVKGQDGLR